MKICIVGAGAIGGLLGVKLAQSGDDLTLIARGAHLAAMKAHGLKLVEEDWSETTVRTAATDRIAEAGVQDLVILAMKAHQVGAVVHELPQLFHAETTVITAQNGLPWWYFMKHGGPQEGKQLESVDPGGMIAKHLPIERVVGAVVYPAAEIVAPGIIRRIEGNRFSVGEIDNTDTQRVRSISDCLRRAGFKAPVLSDIRSEIWTKLWGNLSFNPVSALTHSTLLEICQYPETRELVANMMQEARSVAESLGIRFRVTLEKRIAGAEAVGHHKTSMLQDVEAGRPLEVAALIGSVAEVGRITGIATPHINAIQALISLLTSTLQKQRGILKIRHDSEKG